MGLVNSGNFIKYSIYDTTRLKLIPLTFTPEQEMYTVTANFNYQSLTGRVGQVASYGGSDSEQINFSFDAIQGYLPTGYSDIDEYCKDLKNLTRKNSAGESPSCRLYLGKNVYDGFVNSVEVTKSGPYDSQSRRLKASISINFTVRDDVSREVN